MISIENLHFAYRRNKVFKGLNLNLKAGHIYGLLGKNGTGKSTLLRNIAGLLFPDQGKIEVMGYNPGNRQPLFLQELFMVPEEFFLPNITVDKLVAYNAPFYPRFNKQQFDGYVREFEIPVENT